MGEEKMIQVSLQLPVSELAGLTALAERLTGLLTAGKQEVREQAAAAGFDEARFRELAQDAAGESVPSPASGSEAEKEPTALSDAAALQLPDLNDMAAAKAAESTLSDIPGVERAQGTGFTELAEARNEGRTLPAEPGMDAVKAQPGVPDVVSQVSDGAVPYSEHGNSVVERLVAEGPAPLTAEAVSLAFCRDDRRYDTGFPLY